MKIFIAKSTHQEQVIIGILFKFSLSCVLIEKLLKLLDIFVKKETLKDVKLCVHAL